MIQSIARRFIQPVTAACMVLIVAVFFGTNAAVLSDDNPYLFLHDSVARNVVVEYTGKEEDKQQIMNSMKPRIIELYNPYCGHCQLFKQTYVEVARSVRRDKPYAFYAVSCVAHNDLCRAFGHDDYPTVVAAVSNDMQRSVKISTDRFSAQGVEQAIEEARGKVSVGGMAISGNTVFRRLDEGNEEASDGSGNDKSDVATETENQSNDTTEGETDGSNQDQGIISGVASEEEEDEENGRNEGVENEEDNNKQDEGIEEGDKAEEDNDKQRESDSEEADESEQHGQADESQENSQSYGAEQGEDQDENRPTEDEIALRLEKRYAPAQPYEDEDRGIDSDPQVRPKPGAASAKLLPSEMDRWKRIRADQLAKQKRIQEISKRARQDANEPDDGPTKKMKAHKVDTDEFRERKRKYIEFMMKLQKQRRKRSFDSRSIPAEKIGELSFQKNVRSPRIVENIPVVRQVTKLSKEEELILDCTLAILHGLSYDVFRTNAPLGRDRKAALSDWLDLMMVALPAEWAVTSLMSELRLRIDTVSQSVENMKAFIFKYRFRRTRFSSVCRDSKASPLGCAYWRLFHVVTVGIAEHRGGLNLVDSGIRVSFTRIFSPLEAADTIHNYVRLFFYCSECSRQFVADYEDCDKNRRCDRLTDNALKATDDDWKEVANWLWEVHNDVSVRLLNEAADQKRKKKQQRLILGAGAGPGAALAPNQIQVVWPEIRECVSCFKGDGTWNENAVFRHLEKTYWFDLNTDTVNTGLIWVDGEMIHSPRLTLFLVFIGVILLGLVIHSFRMPVLTRSVLLANRKLGNPKVSLFSFFPKKERTV